MADNLAIIDGLTNTRIIRTTDSGGVHTPHNVIDGTVNVNVVGGSFSITTSSTEVSGIVGVSAINSPVPVSSNEFTPLVVSSINDSINVYLSAIPQGYLSGGIVGVSAGTITVANFPANQEVSGILGVSGGAIDISSITASLTSALNVHLSGTNTVEGIIGVSGGTIVITNLPPTYVSGGMVGVSGGTLSVKNAPPTYVSGGIVGVSGSTVVRNLPPTYVSGGMVGVSGGTLSVKNAPPTYVSGGTVGVSAGTLSINNAPPTYVSGGMVGVSAGTITVDNFPANQEVSGIIGVSGVTDAISSILLDSEGNVYTSANVLYVSNVGTIGSVSVDLTGAIDVSSASFNDPGTPLYVSNVGSIGSVTMAGAIDISSITANLTSALEVHLSGTNTIEGDIGISAIHEGVVGVSGGTLSVNNLPPTYVSGGIVGVSGSIVVGNLPPTYVSGGIVGVSGGSISISNLPANQEVSGVVGVSAIGEGVVGVSGGSITVDNFPAKQEVSGVVGISAIDSVASAIPVIFNSAISEINPLPISSVATISVDDAGASLTVDGTVDLTYNGVTVGYEYPLPVSAVGSTANPVPTKLIVDGNPVTYADPLPVSASNLEATVTGTVGVSAVDVALEVHLSGTNTLEISGGTIEVLDGVLAVSALSAINVGVSAVDALPQIGVSSFDPEINGIVGISSITEGIVGVSGGTLSVNNLPPTYVSGGIVGVSSINQGVVGLSGAFNTSANPLIVSGQAGSTGKELVVQLGTTNYGKNPSVPFTVVDRPRMITNQSTPIFVSSQVIDVSGSGAHQIVVSSTESTQVVVFGVCLVVSGGNSTVKFGSSSIGSLTNLTGPMFLTTNAGFTLPNHGYAWFNTESAEDLVLVLGSAVNAAGVLVYTYMEEDQLGIV